MQIILMEKVANLGILGDIVRVKDGYARNYLIPQGKAKRATDANITEFEQRRAELEKDPDYIMDILKHGTDKCRDITQQTLDEVKSGLGLFKF